MMIVALSKIKTFGQIIAKVPIAKNKMFPVEVSKIDNYVMVVNGDIEDKPLKYLELVHADLWEPMSIESLGGNRSFLLFPNYYNHMSWVYCLENKSEAFGRFKRFKTLGGKKQKQWFSNKDFADRQRW